MAEARIPISVNRIRQLINLIIVCSIISHLIIIVIALSMDPNGPTGLIKTILELLEDANTKGLGIVFMSVIIFIMINLILYITILLSFKFIESKLLPVFFALSIAGIIINYLQLNNKIGKANILIFTILFIIAIIGYYKRGASFLRR